MSNYAKGAETVEGFIVSPGDTKAKIDEIDTEVKILDRDVAAGGADSAVVAAWKDIKTGWDAYRDAHESWFSRLTGQAFDGALDWEKRIDAYRQSFVKAGGRTVAPPPRKDGNVSWGKLAVGVGALGVGGWILGKVLKKFF